jgi:hypothetical protein
MTVSITLVPWVVAILGALIYGLIPGKIAELGKYAFLAGLLAALLHR